MARHKSKFNRKLFNRFKKKELTDFIKKSSLPFEKISKMSKGEIVVNLLRLQRNKLYFDTFAKLEIKGPRKMSPKQIANLAKARLKMKQANQSVKESFPQIQKLDVGRKIVNKNNVETNEIKSLSKLVSQKPSALETAKLDVGDSVFGGEDLEELFVMSNRTINQHREQIMQLLEARKKEVGKNGGNQGKLSLEQADQQQQVVQEPQLELSRVEIEQQPKEELEPQFELEALQEQEEQKEELVEQVQEGEVQKGEGEKAGKERVSEEIQTISGRLNKKKINQRQVNIIANNFGIQFKAGDQGGTKRNKLNLIMQRNPRAINFLEEISRMSKVEFSRRINELSIKPKKQGKKKSSSKVVVKKKN